jgi:hypothetical protein
MPLFGLKRPPKVVLEFCGITGFLTVQRGSHSFATKPENQVDSVPVRPWVTNILRD